ncbi:MAG: response regulator [Verrucomicrobiota bacterium]
MSARPLNILLVEDNLDHAELVRRTLAQFPAPNILRHVEDGEAALDYIFGRGNFQDRSRFPTPDLVLLDLRLPRVDGLDVLRQVRSNPACHRLPIVMLTTSEAERDVVAAFEHQANGFVSKPVDVQRLSHLVQEFEVGGRSGEGGR